MTSLVAWLDYSEDQRRRMREVIDLFRERGTLDELGLGSVRDPFGELLFPGLSTVQTRARYFFFIPWVYRRMEQERTPSARASARTRHLQTQIIYALERAGTTGGEGIIGWEAREKLDRLPSYVYWSGLRTYGIRLFSGSIADYHRSLDGFHRRLHDHVTADGDEPYERLPANWNPELPSPPDGFWEETSISLRPVEAEFLADRILLTNKRSLLGHFLLHPDQAIEQARYPWDMPAMSAVEEPIRTWLYHAQLFSVVMHGAALTYNLLSARLAATRGIGPASTDLADAYLSELESWADEVSALSNLVNDWDLDEFWSVVAEANPRVPHLTRRFIDRWVLETRADPGRIATVPDDIADLIEGREAEMKGSQARLRNRRALELWSGESGTARLDYRWPTARRVLADIYEGWDRAEP